MHLWKDEKCRILSVKINKNKNCIDKSICIILRLYIYLQYLLCLQFCESFIIFFEIKFHCANKKRNTLDFLFLNFYEKMIYFCNLLVEDLSITVVISNLFNIKHKNTCAVREKQSVQSNRYFWTNMENITYANLVN